MAGLSVSLQGADKLDALGERLRRAGRTDLLAELKREMRKPPKRLEAAVRAEVAPRMPAGYERPLGSSLRFRTSFPRGATVGVSVTMDGRGRAVRALDAGILKHPVFGRRRRTTRGRVFNNPWVTQRIQPGFFTQPARRVLRQVQDDTVAAIDRVAAKIAKG